MNEGYRNLLSHAVHLVSILETQGVRFQSLTLSQRWRRRDPIQPKATEQEVSVQLLTMLYEVDATFQSVDEILKCGHSSESYWAVLSVRLLVILCKVHRNFKPLYWWRIAICSRRGMSTFLGRCSLFVDLFHISLVSSDRFPKFFKRGTRALSVLYFFQLCFVHGSAPFVFCVAPPVALFRAVLSNLKCPAISRTLQNSSVFITFLILDKKD